MPYTDLNMKTHENDENRTVLDPFASGLIDSWSVATLLWHKSLATSFCLLISYRFQIVPVSCER